MLKKLLKAALTACIVAGMSTAAMAWVPVGDSGMLLQLDTSGTYGQYNSGVEDTAGYFKAKSETNISWLAMKAPWTVWADIEFDDNDTMKNPRAADTDPATKGLKDMDAVASYVKYAISPALYVKIGSIHHLAGLQYALGFGMVTKTTGHEGWDHSGYSESPGLEFGYQVSPDLLISFAQYAQGAIAMTGQFEGTAMGIQAMGKAGDIGYKFGYISETTADYDNKDHEGLSNSCMNLGVKIPFGNMWASVDYSTFTNNTWYGADTAFVTTDMAFQLGMKKMGPGDLRIGYAMIADTLGGDPASAEADLGLAYNIPAGPGFMQIQYTTKTTTPEGGDAVTQSWMGFGMNFTL